MMSYAEEMQPAIACLACNAEVPIAAYGEHDCGGAKALDHTIMSRHDSFATSEGGSGHVSPTVLHSRYTLGADAQVLAFDKTAASRQQIHAALHDASSSSRSSISSSAPSDMSLRSMPARSIPLSRYNSRETAANRTNMFSTRPRDVRGALQQGHRAQHSEPTISMRPKRNWSLLRPSAPTTTNADDMRYRAHVTCMEGSENGLDSPNRGPHMRTVSEPLLLAPAVRARRHDSRCRGCDTIIVGKSIKASGGSLSGRYHASCFACQRCRKPFTTADFYIIDDAPYCEFDYHELNGSLCVGCNRGIEGEYVELRSLQRFHPHCVI